MGEIRFVGTGYPNPVCKNRNTFSIFFNLKVCCVFSLESPHRGDSNENTQYTIFNIKKKITLKCAAMGFFSKGLKI